MKVAFVVPYPKAMAPSQRFRFEQQLSFFTNQNINFDFYPFLSEQAFSILYKPKLFLVKAFYIFLGFFKRFFLLFRLPVYDFVFIHREASPIGPPIFEFIIAKILRKKIIYDFDDAIWLSNTSSSNKIVAGLKFHSKVSLLCKWAHKVSCGNAFLADFAKKYNKNVTIIPTTVDTTLVHNKTKNQNTEKLVVGWTGTHSTIKYLYELEPILVEVQHEIDFEFIVISNKDPLFQNLKYTYIAWSKKSEIEDLLKFNIGVMPLKENLWSAGKCGFKAIQYMSLGIPAVVSAVGVNTKIVSNNENSFVCTTKNEWKQALVRLLKNNELRTQFGQKAQEKIKGNYSTLSQESSYLSLFEITSI